MSDKQEQEKIDGLENSLSRRGKRGESKSGSDSFNSSGFLSDYQLRTMFNENGIGASTVSRIVNDAYRKGFKVDDDNLQKQFADLGGHKKFHEAALWARLFGGSIIVMLINDGAVSLEEPLNPNKVQSIDGLLVYDKTQVTIPERFSDPQSPDYENPVYYTVSATTMFNVHHTRVIRFGGITTDWRTKQQLNYWDMSAMQPVYDSLVDYLAIMKDGKQIMSEFVIGVLKMKNIMDLSRTEAGSAIVRKRIDLLDETKSNENTVVCDAVDEDYTKHMSSISGYAEVLEGAQTAVAGSCSPMMPQTVLFGRSPGGQNATGESDLTLWYDSVVSYQENEVTPQLMQFFDLIAGGKEYTIDHNPLTEATDAEQAKAFSDWMTGYEKTINTGMYSPEEIALHRKDVELLYERVAKKPTELPTDA